jgi:hypothetical protein
MGAANTATGLRYYKNDIITGAVTACAGMGVICAVNRLFFSPGGYACRHIFDPGYYQLQPDRDY